MSLWISRFLHPPHFPEDEPKTRQAEILNSLLMAELLVVLIGIGPGVLFVFANKWFSGLVLGVALLSLLGNKVALHAGYVQSAAALNLIGTWLLVTIAASISNGAASADAFLYFTVIVNAGLLFGSRAAIGAAVASMLVLLLIALTDPLGLHLPNLLPMPIQSRWSIFALSVVWVITPLIITLRRLAQALHLARQELVERNEIQLEREKLIVELAAKNAELERYTYTVSHDLKSPLVTIRGFLGYLEQDITANDSARLKDDMNRIVDATDRMQRLLTELLELSRIGRLMNASQAAPLETIVGEALAQTQGSLDARGVQIEVAPDLPTVYGDRARLVEVLQNLIDNACKFMGDQAEPHISIGMRGTDREGRPIVFVRDNGMGIEPQYHEKVFGLFDKLNSESEGTGIGLALVKRIVEVHGGRIWVESEGQYKGSTFCFTLPAGSVT